MKSTKTAVKSFKNLISKTQASKKLVPNQNFGETVIPLGSDDLFVELPNLSNTYTYNIINTAEMLGNITLRTTGGASLKGLILNNVGGTLNIEPIPQGATSFEMASDVKDGCFVQTVSNGNEWFIWSVATHGSLGISQVGGSTGGVTGGGTTSGPQTPTGTVTTVIDPVLVDSVVPTTTFPAPSLEARHSLEISGRAQPNTTIAVSEDNGAIQTITGIPVDSNGDWGPITIPNLESGTYSFDFIDESSNPGDPALGETFADNTGALTFVTPSSFTVERGTSFDFTAGAYATDPSGNQIASFNTDASDYTINRTHGETFDIVYSFSYNGTPYTRTVSGVVDDTIAPAKPTIASATFDSVNINDFTATGAAEDGSTVEIFFDGVSQGTVTSIGGTWTFNKTFVFNQTFDITVQAVDNAGNVSEESDPTSVVYSPPTLARPTLTINNAPTNTWTNQGNPIQISVTATAGSAIVIKDGNQVVTPVSGPTYNGSSWDVEINVANESNSSLTAEVSEVGFNSPSPSTTKTLLVDRVPPAISGTPLGDLTVYLGNIGTNNDSIPTATDFSSATVTSDWATQVDATEGAKTVTYTATDAAGNTATSNRTITITTEVIVPVITSVTDNGDGTATVVGTVTGTYADNLTVQILVDGANSGSPVSVSTNSFTATVSSLTTGTYGFTAKTINSESEESAESISFSKDITAPVDTTPPVITITSTETESYSVNFTIEGTIDDLTATLTSGVDTITINGDGTWEYDVTLTEDQLNSFTFTAVDTVGNPSTPQTFNITHVPPLFLEDDANTSGDLTIDSIYSSYVYYHTDGTLIHDVGSTVSNGGVASIPVRLMSSTNTPDSIAYSVWFYLDPNSVNQARLLKGTSGGSPSHDTPNGPGIVWHAGGPYLREATSGITGGAPVNTHPDGSDANTFYPPAGSNLARSAWHHVIVQHEWDSANTKWLTNVFINGGIATDSTGNEVSDVHIDSDNTSQSILDTTKFNYLVSSEGTQIDSYNVVINPSTSITAAIASTIYSDSTRQTGILDAIQQNP